MSHFYSIHPVNPQQRLLQKAVAIIKTGGLVVFPTDSGYCLGCSVENTQAVKRIRAIRELTSAHHMTLMLPDLTGLGHYVRIKTAYYRMIKTLLPGHYTFILPGTRDIPKLMAHPKRRDIGIRIPDNTIALSLLSALDAPLVTTTLILPGAEEPLSEAEAIEDILGKKVDLILEGGELTYHPTTVIDLTDDEPKIIRRGAGQTALFE